MVPRPFWCTHIRLQEQAPQRPAMVAFAEGRRSRHCCARHLPACCRRLKFLSEISLLAEPRLRSAPSRLLPASSAGADTPADQVLNDREVDAPARAQPEGSAEFADAEDGVHDAQGEHLCASTECQC